MKARGHGITSLLFWVTLSASACEEKAAILEPLREAARAADEKDKFDFPVNYFSPVASHPSQFSVLRGTEWKYLSSQKYSDRAVIYLASGPDIYRLVHDFPEAREFHFFDLWTGWGSSRAEVLTEAHRRLEQLAVVAGASVQRESAGFLTALTGESYQSKADLSREELRSPLIDEAIMERFTRHLADGSTDERRFYFHQIDFSDAKKMRAALNTIQGRRPIGAVLIAGGPLPRWSARRALRKSLMPGGSIVVESSDIDDSVKATRRLFARGAFRFRFGGRHYISGAGGGHNPDYYLKDLALPFFMNQQTLIFEKD